MRGEYLAKLTALPLFSVTHEPQKQQEYVYYSRLKQPQSTIKNNHANIRDNQHDKSIVLI